MSSQGRLVCAVSLALPAGATLAQNAVPFPCDASLAAALQVLSTTASGGGAAFVVTGASLPPPHPPSSAAAAVSSRALAETGEVRRTCAP